MCACFKAGWFICFFIFVGWCWCCLGCVLENACLCFVCVVLFVCAGSVFFPVWLIYLFVDLLAGAGGVRDLLCVVRCCCCCRALGRVFLIFVGWCWCCLCAVCFILVWLYCLLVFCMFLLCVVVRFAV